MTLKYGLLDTYDHVWMGGDDGPKLFDQEILARIAAQVLDVQLGQEPGRTKATLYTENAWKLKDEVTPKMTPLTALKLIERGQL